MQPHDRLFCEIAVQLQLLTREQVAACMRTLQSDPRGRNVESVAASLGFLTREQVDLVLSNQQRVLERRREARSAQRARRDPVAARATGTGASRALPDPRPAGPQSGVKPPDGRSARSKDATPTTPWQQRAGAEPRLGQPELTGREARETMDERPLPRGLSATLLQGTPTAPPPSSGPRAQLAAGAFAPKAPLPAASTAPRLPSPRPANAQGQGEGAAAGRVSYSPPLQRSAAPPSTSHTSRSGGVSSRAPDAAAAPAAAISHSQSARAGMGHVAARVGSQPSAANTDQPVGPIGGIGGGTLLGASALANPHEGRAVERAARPKRSAAAKEWRNPSRPPPAGPSLDAEPVALPLRADTPDPGANSPFALRAPTLGAPDFLERALELAVDAGASDLHLHHGSALFVRIDGKLWPLASETPVAGPAAEQVIGELLDDEQRTQLTLEGELRFAYEFPELGRVRAHAYCQQRGVDLVLRLLPATLPTPEKLGLAAAVRAVREHDSGLCLCTGPSGAGKSTTIAAVLKALASERALYGVSLEHPIEIVHAPALGVIEQRELGADIASFAHGVDTAVRMGADVIAVDDIADQATLAACLRAARNGCLVLAGLRASSCAQALARLLCSVEGAQLERMRLELAQALRLVLHQRLLPRARAPGRVPVLESVANTPQLAQVIREDKLQQLANVMAAGKAAGMVALDDALEELVRAGTITGEAARRAAHRRDRFKA